MLTHLKFDETDNIAGITIVLLGNHKFHYQKVFQWSDNVFDICIKPVEESDVDDENYNYVHKYNRIWKIPTRFRTGDVISCKMGPIIKGYHKLDPANCPKCGEKKSVTREIHYGNFTDICDSLEFSNESNPHFVPEDYVPSSQNPKVGAVTGLCKKCGEFTPCFMGGFPTQTCVKLCVRDELIPKTTRLVPLTRECNCNHAFLTRSSTVCGGCKKRVVKIHKKSKEIFPKNMLNAMCFGTGNAKIVGCSDMDCVYEGCQILLEKLRVLDRDHDIWYMDRESAANWMKKRPKKIEFVSDDVIRFRPTIAMINVRMELGFDAPLVKMVEFLLNECPDLVDVTTISVANHNKPYVSINIKKDEPDELEDIAVMGWDWTRGTDDSIQTELVSQNTSTKKSVTLKFEPPRKMTFTILHYIEPKINTLIDRLLDTQDIYFINNSDKVREEIRQLLIELK